MKKKSILLGIMIALFIFNLGAQETKLEIGVKAGLNYSTLVGNSGKNGEFNAKIGYNIGVFLNHKLNEKLYLKPELLFSRQRAEYVLNIENLEGGPFDPEISSTKYIVEIKENLIVLPIMIDYYLSEKINLEFGTQLAYVLSQDVSDNNKNINFQEEDFDKFEVGLNLGIGYNFAEKYRLGVRYNYGIIERNNYNSSVFQISLNYKI